MEVPQPFLYKATKLYPIEIRESGSDDRKLTRSTFIMELSGVSHLTRSGRCYALSAQEK